MPVKGRYIILLLALFVMMGCKHKKKPSLTGEEPVDVADFIEFFQPVNLTYQLTDTALLRKEKDSAAISYKIFTQFVPDSVLAKIYGKGVKPKIYPLGRVSVPKGETYLFAKTVSNDKRAAFVLGFDNKQKYISALTAMRPDNNAATLQSFSMDRKYAITKSVLQKNADGSMSEGKDVYTFSPAEKDFILIMTDALNDKVTELINPIDTLPRKHKFSADYSSGKMNLVSVRDGRKADRISFFIHFEKNDGECTGELKGEALIRSATTAEYRQEGDPCILKLIFSKTAVTLSEEEGCGSRRGLKCSFDGSFARKKAPAPPKVVTKKK